MDDQGRNPAIDVRAFSEFWRSLWGASGEGKDLSVFLQPKIAGVSLSFSYVEAHLQGVTIFGGPDGDTDVTKNARTILTLPLVLDQRQGGPPVPEVLTLLGVAYMEKEAFSCRRDACKRQGRPVPPSGKAAVLQALKAEPPGLAAREPLSLFMEEVLGVRPSPFPCYDALMEALQGWGLRVNKPLFRVCGSMEEALARCREMIAGRAELPYTVEGFLLRSNLLSPQGHLPPEEGRRWFPL